MSLAAGDARGPVPVVTAVPGVTESAVAALLSGRREVSLVRRCADVAELLSVAEAGLAAVAVLGEGFDGLDADVVDRLRRSGCGLVGVVDPDRQSSERLRAWDVPVVVVAAAGGALEPATTDETLPTAVLAAAASPRSDGRSGGYSRPSGSGGAPAADRDRPGAAAPLRPGSGADGAQGHGGHGGDGGYGPEPDDLGPDPLDWVDGVDSSGGDEASAGGGGPATSDGRPPVRAAGRVVAVWGPPGAPGRTTVAVGLAAELAASGAEVLLVDADTYAASVAQVLGLLDEAPGLVAAVRAGLDGRLDPGSLARLAPTAAPGLRVLGGLTRAARWSELRPAGLEAVLGAGRRLVDHVVVDLAPPLEEDDELSYDTAAPRRNGAALQVLRAADDVVVVGSADPVGLQRLVRGLQDLAVAVPGSSPLVVVNRVRSDAVGRNPRLRVREALERFAGVRDMRLVPDDRPATDRALLAGLTLAEAAPDSPAREALRALAGDLRRLAGAPGATGTARTRRREAAPVRAGRPGAGRARRRGATGG